MATVSINFTHLVQDSQDAGSDNEHMISRAFFSITVNGEEHKGLHADLKQTSGSNYATDPVEVSRPANYSGPLDWNKFRRCVEQYYRSLVGAEGSGIRIGPGATNVRMRNNFFGKTWSCSFEAADGGSVAW